MPQKESALKQARIARGISQSELARRAEISRQALNAIESGVYQPGVQVALKLARELGESVESLFGAHDAGSLAAAWIDERAARSGTQVALARLGGRLVALGQPSVDLRMAAAAGVVETARGRSVTVTALRTPEEIDATLIVAGCDPSVTILADWLRRHRAPVTIVALTRSSRAALAALMKGRAHVAGVHLRDPRSGAYNEFPMLKVGAERRLVRINFARWELGIATAPGNPLKLRSWQDLARPGLRIVNREAGAGARMALDEAIAELGLNPRALAGYARELGGHLEVAGAIAAGEADCGVTIRVAANAYGLGFVALREERYDLVMPAALMKLEPARIVVEALHSDQLHHELSALCAYDTHQTGQVIA
jgi:molybdate-binding protein/DNA-binding XRE family transcriptional regulator